MSSSQSHPSSSRKDHTYPSPPTLNQRPSSSLPHNSTSRPDRQGFWNTVMDTSSTSAPLSTHRNVTRSTPKPLPVKQFNCKICGARFERRGHLEAHVETVHEGKRPHRCPHGCGKQFGHRSSLSRHIKTAHDLPQAPSKSTNLAPHKYYPQ